MKRIYIIIVVLFGSFLNNSCESLDLEGQENPNTLNLSKVDVNLLLTQTQIDFRDFFYEVSDDVRPLVRMVGQFGTYPAAADPQESQNQWSYAYANVLKNTQVIGEVAKSKPIPHHLGIANVLEAYTMVTLVDFYGDVPYSQALLGSNNLNPKVDSGSSIYDAMIVKLDEAIVLFGQSNSAPLTDLYYNGNMSKWVKLANSLKLKIYNNLRLTRDVSTQVNAIVASGNIMTSNADDFNFVYTTASSPAESRHPDFTANYFSAKAFYLSNSYYNLVQKDKGLITDPRNRCYFYRQTRTSASGTDLPCTTNTAIPICSVGGGYWGRDHADNTGIPNDNTRRTIVGLYPAGGKFDNGVTAANVNNNNGDITNAVDKGAAGAGILNILDYSFVQFILAELALTEPGVVAGTPESRLTSAVTNNISKVMNFRVDLQGTNKPTAAMATAYINKVNADYAALATDAARLNYIIKESFIAYWGNGMEPYNAYRRTGCPTWNSTTKIGSQPPVIAAGDFVRSFFYPKNALDNNTSIKQHPITDRVFWDNNAPGFIN